MGLIDKVAVITLTEAQVDDLLKTVGIAIGNLQTKKRRISGDKPQEGQVASSLNNLVGVQQQLLGALVEGTLDE